MHDRYYHERIHHISLAHTAQQRGPDCNEAVGYIRGLSYSAKALIIEHRIITAETKSIISKNITRGRKID